MSLAPTPTSVHKDNVAYRSTKSVVFALEAPQVIYIPPSMGTWENSDEQVHHPTFEQVKNARKLAEQTLKEIKKQEIDDETPINEPAAQNFDGILEARSSAEPLESPSLTRAIAMTSASSALKSFENLYQKTKTTPQPSDESQHLSSTPSFQGFLRLSTSGAGTNLSSTHATSPPLHPVVNQTPVTDREGSTERDGNSTWIPGREAFNEDSPLIETLVQATRARRADDCDQQSLMHLPPRSHSGMAKSNAREPNVAEADSLEATMQRPSLAATQSHSDFNDFLPPNRMSTWEQLDRRPSDQRSVSSVASSISSMISIKSLGKKAKEKLRRERGNHFDGGMEHHRPNLHPDYPV